MQNRINLDYLNRTDLVAETKRAILRAVKHYEKERFWFNQTATALAIGTASTSVAIPADFIALDFCTVRDTLIDSIVVIRSFDRIAYQNRNSAQSGVPIEIAYWQDKLVFTPKPSSATSLTVNYTHTLPVLSADADTNAWTSAGEDLIIHHAMADMLANVLRVADAGQVQAHKAWELEAYKMLKFGNDMRLNAGQEGSVRGAIQGQAPKLPDATMP
jgi:hypothetical protein